MPRKAFARIAGRGRRGIPAAGGQRRKEEQREGRHGNSRMNLHHKKEINLYKDRERKPIKEPAFGGCLASMQQRF